VGGAPGGAGGWAQVVAAAGAPRAAGAVPQVMVGGSDAAFEVWDLGLGWLVLLLGPAVPWGGPQVPGSGLAAAGWGWGCVSCASWVWGLTG
jgi:hypothetical protein